MLYQQKLFLIVLCIVSHRVKHHQQKIGDRRIVDDGRGDSSCLITMKSNFGSSDFYPSLEEFGLVGGFDGDEMFFWSLNMPKIREIGWNDETSQNLFFHPLGVGSVKKFGIYE